MKKTALTMAALALAFTTACGGGGGGSDRPSQSDISKALTSEKSVSGQLTKPQAKCVSKILEESKLSDKTLQALVKKDTKYKGTKADNKILASLSTKINKDCEAAK